MKIQILRQAFGQGTEHCLVVESREVQISSLRLMLVVASVVAERRDAKKNGDRMHSHGPEAAQRELLQSTFPTFK
jgi:hypothetical protein